MYVYRSECPKCIHEYFYVSYITTSNAIFENRVFLHKPLADAVVVGPSWVHCVYQHCCGHRINDVISCFPTWCSSLKS